MLTFLLLFDQGKSESITVVKLLSCFDDLVAVGTASGKIAVFQLVSSLPGRNKQVRPKLDLKLVGFKTASNLIVHFPGSQVKDVCFTLSLASML